MSMILGCNTELTYFKGFGPDFISVACHIVNKERKRLTSAKTTFLIFVCVCCVTMEGVDHHIPRTQYRKVKHSHKWAHGLFYIYYQKRHRKGILCKIKSTIRKGGKKGVPEKKQRCHKGLHGAGDRMMDGCIPDVRPVKDQLPYYARDQSPKSSIWRGHSHYQDPRIIWSCRTDLAVVAASSVVS